MDKKPVKRSKLAEKIESFREKLAPNVFIATSIRATANNSLQLEVAQHRMLDGQTISVLTALNESDQRFGKNGTLLYDWLKFEPVDLLKLFPQLKMTVAELESIAETYDESSPDGPDALVYPVMVGLDKMVIDGRTYEPIINVTEVIESKIPEFYTERSKRREENIANALEHEYRVMKTGSEEDAEHLVHPVTGERIFRFTQTNPKGQPNAVDQIVAGKVPKSVWASRESKSTTDSQYVKPENILEQTETV